MNDKDEFPTYFKTDPNDWYEERYARGFWRWKIAKWFVISAFLFAFGMRIGVAVALGRA